MKTRIIALILLVALALAACSPSTPSSSPEPTAQTEEENNLLDQGPVDLIEELAPDQEDEPVQEDADASSKFPDFTTTDIDGNEVTQEIFSDYKLTMVNMWATWCGPCVNELPDLQKLSTDYADKGFQLIGLVDDYSPLEDIRSYIDLNGLTYRMINWNDVFASLQTGYVPTTYFIDSEGNIIGEAQIGSNSYEGWSAIIDEILADLG